MAAYRGFFNRVPSNYMIEKGENARRFFERTGDTTGDPKKRFALKSRETYSREQKKTELPGKKYFHTTKLKDLIMEYALPRKGMSDQEKDRGRCNLLEQLALQTNTANGIHTEKQNRLALIDFLQGVLKLDPIVRWSPQQAKNHPFITGERFVGPYQPDHIRRMPILPDTALATNEKSVIASTSQGPILPTTQPVMSSSRLQENFTSSFKLRPRSKTFSSTSSSGSPSNHKQRTSSIAEDIREDVIPQAISTATDVERNLQWANDSGRDSIRYRNRHGDSFSGSTTGFGQEGLKRRSTHGPSKSTAISDNNLKRSPSDVNRVKINDVVRIHQGDDTRYESTNHIRRGPETDVESQTKAGRRHTGTYLAEEPQGLIPLPDRQRDLEEGNANMDESYPGKQGVSDNIGLHMVGGLLRRRASERL